MRYSQIVFMQGDEAAEIVDALERVDGVVAHGATNETLSAAFDALRECDNGEDFDIRDEDSSGPNDKRHTFMVGDAEYLMSWNLGLSYIGLQRVMPSEIDARAAELGAERGKSAAGWTFDGNTSRETYARFLKLSDDGDPELYDTFGPTSGWLSGEWGDDTTARDLQLELEISDDDDEILAEACDAYETAADEAYWAELERVARLHTSD